MFTQTVKLLSSDYHQAASAVAAASVTEGMPALPGAFLIPNRWKAGIQWPIDIVDVEVSSMTALATWT